MLTPPPNLSIRLPRFVCTFVLLYSGIARGVQSTKLYRGPHGCMKMPLFGARYLFWSQNGSKEEGLDLLACCAVALCKLSDLTPSSYAIALHTLARKVKFPKCQAKPDIPLDFLPLS